VGKEAIMAYVCPFCKSKINELLLEAYYAAWDIDKCYIDYINPYRNRIELGQAGSYTEKETQPYKIKVYCPTCHGLLCEVDSLTRLTEEVEKCVRIVKDS
jgi:Zn finger protein HypA/HybF involved in hydrogenase expression